MALLRRLTIDRSIPADDRIDLSSSRFQAEVPGGATAPAADDRVVELPLQLTIDRFRLDGEWIWD
jgi:hypothetical protein